MRSNFYIFWLSVGLLLFSGCTKDVDLPVDSEESFSSSSTVWSAESSASWSEEVVSPTESMRLSYQQAVAILKTTNDLWDDFDTDTQTVLTQVIEILSDDVKLLGYYVNVSEHEPLSDEEVETVANLMIDIEEGVNILVSAIDNLL